MSDALSASKSSNEASGLPPSPDSNTRFDFVFARLNRLFGVVDGIFRKWLPDESNPMSQAGASALVSLLVATASGIAMLIWYKPSVHLAYSSMHALEGQTLGGWIRTIHRYSSDLTMLLLFVHAGRTFVARKFSGARWLAWVTGVAMMALIWLIGWTGYWLIWDQPAQEVAMSSMRLFDALPIFGEPMSRLFVADRLIPSLLFFVVFFVHMLLPLGIAIGLGIHLMRLSRSKLLPSKVVSWSIVIAIGAASLAFPAPLGEAASMSVKAESFVVDAWYMSPLALGLRFQEVGLWVAMFGGVGISALIPWILGRKPKSDSMLAKVNVARCHSCSQCSQDCPFEAITLVPRTDGKAFPMQAQVNPNLCVGCGVCSGSCDSGGIGLQWFDTPTEEKRIEREVLGRIETGGCKWVAFISGEIDGGIDYFEKAKWKDRLPGYQIQFQPTSSWITSRLVERLLRKGIEGILIVNANRHERASRDGDKWVSQRLSGRRSPKLKTRSASDGDWLVVDFNDANVGSLRSTAIEFRNGVRNGLEPRRPSVFRKALGIAAIFALLGGLTIGPSRLNVANPSPMGPEFVLSFKAFGDWDEAKSVELEDQENIPVHMRGRDVNKPKRIPVFIYLKVDGVAQERRFKAKGVSHDGPAIDQWRMPLDVGAREIEVVIDRGGVLEDLHWIGTVEAQDRRIYVLTYDPKEGFILEE